MEAICVMLLAHDQPASQAGNVQNAALLRALDGLEIATRLEEIGRLFDSKDAQAAAEMVRECVSPENIVIAYDLHNANGEKFDGIIALNKCRLRFCPFCSELLPRRDRRRARLAVSSVRLRDGEHWQFITLTAPKIKDAGLFIALQVFRRAWSLLRKRRWWKENVRGGIKNHEWTTNEGAGYNAHLHLLVFGRLKFGGLDYEWTECIKKAWSEHGYEIEINTSDALAEVKRDTVSEGDRVKCVNYIFKAAAWDSVPDAHLVEIVELRRWPRLFEVFGDARKASVILDTSNLSDGKRTLPKAHRISRATYKLSDTVDYKAWLEIVRKSRDKRREFLEQKYPNATFDMLKFAENPPRAALGSGNQICLMLPDRRFPPRAAREEATASRLQPPPFILLRLEGAAEGSVDGRRID
jgi:hypothetical protein